MLLQYCTAPNCTALYPAIMLHFQCSQRVQDRSACGRARPRFYDRRKDVSDHVGDGEILAALTCETFKVGKSVSIFDSYGACDTAIYQSRRRLRW